MEGKLHMISESGVKVRTSSAEEGDFLFRNRGSLDGPTAPNDGSLYYIEGSGMMVAKTQQINWFGAQPVSIGPFYLQNPSALAINAMYYGGVNSTNGVEEFVAPYPGTIIAISATWNANQTAGQARFRALKNGSATSPTFYTDIFTGGTKSVAGKLLGEITFAIGDTLSTEVLCDASFGPTTLDGMASLWVIFESPV